MKGNKIFIKFKAILCQRRDCALRCSTAASGHKRWWGDSRMMISHLYQGKKSRLKTVALAAGLHYFLTDCLCACNGHQLLAFLTTWLSAAMQTHGGREKTEWVRGFMEMCGEPFEDGVESNMLFAVMHAVVVILKWPPCCPWRLTDLNTAQSVYVCVCFSSRRQRLPAVKHRVGGSRCSWRRSAF